MSQQTRPSGHYIDITPHDTTNLEPVNHEWPRAIYVGADGTFVAVRVDDTAVTFNNAKAGSVIPISFKRINSTGTTASMNLRALY